MAAEGEGQDGKDPQLPSESTAGQFLQLPTHLRPLGSSSSLAAMSDSSARPEGSDDADEFNSTNLSQDPEDSGLAFIERCVGDAAFAPIHFQEFLSENLEEIFPSSPSEAGETKDTLLRPPTSPRSTTGEKQRTPLEKYLLWGRLSSPFLVFLFIGVVFVVLARSHLSQLLDLLEHLPWFESTVIFVFLFTVIAFPFGIGYIVLNMVAGYLYGFMKGQLVVMVSVTIGMTVSFFFCRIWFREYAQRIVTSNAMQAIMRVVEGKNGLKVIVLTRLTPIPFGLQNVLFSVSLPHVSQHCTTAGCKIVHALTST